MRMRGTYQIADKNALESRILWGVSFTIVIVQTFIAYLDNTIYRNLLQEKFLTCVGSEKERQPKLPLRD